MMMASDAGVLDKAAAAGTASALASLVVAPLEVVKVSTALALPLYEPGVAGNFWSTGAELRAYLRLC